MFQVFQTLKDLFGHCFVPTEMSYVTIEAVEGRFLVAEMFFTRFKGCFCVGHVFRNIRSQIIAFVANCVSGAGAVTYAASDADIIVYRRQPFSNRYGVGRAFLYAYAAAGAALFVYPGQRGSSFLGVAVYTGPLLPRPAPLPPGPPRRLPPLAKPLPPPVSCGFSEFGRMAFCGQTVRHSPHLVHVIWSITALPPVMDIAPDGQDLTQAIQPSHISLRIQGIRSNTVLLITIIIKDSE